LAPLSALVRGTFATQEPLTRPEYSSKYSNVSGNGLVQLTKAYDSGLEFSAGGVRSGRRSQPQDKRAPRASYVARGDQVISHRLPSGSAMNAERPPHDRSVAAATGVAPAVTAASNALSTSSRIPAVQASVTPDRPVGAVPSGAASAVRSGRSAGRAPARHPRGETRFRSCHRWPARASPTSGRTSGGRPCLVRPA